MKKIILPLCLAAASVAVAFGQEQPPAQPGQPAAPPNQQQAPEPDPNAGPGQPPPPGGKDEIHGPAHKDHARFEQKIEQRTFLGIETGPVPPVTAAQLGIPEGFGLVVEFVVPDSPAATAQVQRYDILTKIEDQQLINPSQLASLVRSFPDGKDVALTVLRKGQEVKITAKLVRKALPVAFSPENWREEFGKFPGLHSGEWPGLRKMKDALRKEGNVSARFNDGKWLSKIDMADLHVVSNDQNGTLEIRSKDGKRTLIATKPDGSIVFNGPIDTDEQKKAVPGDVQKRLENMENERLPEPPAPIDEPAPPLAPETT